MSVNNLSTNELLDRYLSGAITAPQEAELERRAVEDPVLAEALEGVLVFPEADHAARVRQMVARTKVNYGGAGAQAKVPTESGVQGKGRGAKVRPLGRYLAAASVLLLLAAAVFLFPRFAGDPSADLAMKQEAPTLATAPEPVPEITPVLAEEETPDRPAPTPDPVGAVERPGSASGSGPVAASAQPAPPPTVSGVPESAVVSDADAAMETETAAAIEAEVEAIALEEAAIVVPPQPVEPLVVKRREAQRLAQEAAERAAAERRKRAAAERSEPPEPNQPQSMAGGQPIAANRQSPTVFGRITDDSGEPIVGALVRLPGLPLGERTDTNGIFRLNVDITTSRIDISHPDYENESFDIRNQLDAIQLSLEAKEKKDYQDWTNAWAATKIPISNEPGFAIPEEGYNTLRKRIEENRPATVPLGKVKLSFTVNPDGTLEDFIFKGRPSQETMDYVGGTIARTSIWNVMKGDKPVRVYFKVVFAD